MSFIATISLTILAIVFAGSQAAAGSLKANCLERCTSAECFEKNSKIKEGKGPSKSFEKIFVYSQGSSPLTLSSYHLSSASFEVHDISIHLPSTLRIGSGLSPPV
ncbi:MAG: hypothetical protein WC635_11195 [Bacteriovorax sp.]|jgi:hypothetical protein